MRTFFILWLVSVVVIIGIAAFFAFNSASKEGEVDTQAAECSEKSISYEDWNDECKAIGMDSDCKLPVGTIMLLSKKTEC